MMIILIKYGTEQISRQPFEFPTIEIINKRECINDYVLEDFKINNYQSHDQIKGTMRA
jgi:thymidylate synthase